MKKIIFLFILFSPALFAQHIEKTGTMKVKKPSDYSCIKATFAGEMDSTIATKRDVQIGQGVIVHYYYCSQFEDQKNYPYMDFKCVSYRFSAYTKKTNFQLFVKGRAIPNEMKKILNDIHIGDKIVFDKIMAQGPETKIIELSKIIITVCDKNSEEYRKKHPRR